ncbi:MAG: 4-(cytidine 5'-diphospho)-2-C-methyl-D-erythritol kinase [Defluviitaleaceae bacterium]|nr:4-(cytidine 5'-diphospho)-2-C-methyl-D-erythritol kinase [Defluviitaleaceae bacterium]MCL2837267.1 4-(cytidine 5'-diphospho)-2-C-methyl-D-erythritol kinase [Defluviitaleaceae bacterium]
MGQIKLLARAKVNLAIDVLGRRPDGYHELSGVMQSITLADTVTIAAGANHPALHEAQGPQLRVEAASLPSDERNIAYRAAKLLIDKCGIEDNVSVTIEKRIPMAAGLAGGSADCAAVLAGMRSLFKLEIPFRELLDIGLSLGADVPFCLTRGTQLAEGVGERLSHLRPIPRSWLVLAKPPFSVSTSEIFKSFNPSAAKRPDIERLLYYIKKSDLRGICSQLANALESVTISIHPVINKIKELMLEHGALGAVMSGSGPTVFGVFSTHEHASRVKNVVNMAFPDIEALFLTRTFNVY